MKSASAWLAAQWVRIYTCGMSMEERMARRDEIAADIWDHVNDRSVVHGTTGLLSRVIAGVPADLVWSYQTRGGVESVVRMTSERLSIDRKVAVGLWCGMLAIAFAGFVLVTNGVLGTIVLIAAAVLGGGVVVIRKLTSGTREGAVRSVNGLSRNVLVSVLVISLLVVVGTALIAFNDETWGETGSIFYNLLGLVGMAGILWSTVMLVTRLARNTSR
jgi:hypothetical protein